LELGLGLGSGPEAMARARVRVRVEVGVRVTDARAATPPWSVEVCAASLGGAVVEGVLSRGRSAARAQARRLLPVW